MTLQKDSIEKKYEVVHQEFEELKYLFDEVEKKDKSQEVKKKVNWLLDLLGNDSAILIQKNELDVDTALAYQENLKNINIELDTIIQGIDKKAKTEDSNPSESSETPEDSNTDKKEEADPSFRDKTKSSVKEGRDKTTGFVKENRASVWDKEKWSSETGTNIARAAGFAATGVGAAALAYKGLKSLFWRGKKEKKEEGSEKKEKKWGFRKGFLKWTGITVWGTWLWRGLITGTWDFFWWNPFKKGTELGATTPWSSPEKASQSYELLTSERKKLYEDYSKWQNEYFSNAMGADEQWSLFVEDMLGDSWFDKEKMGVVPYMLAERYTSVDKLLSEGSFFYEISILETKQWAKKIKDWWIDKLRGVVSGTLWAVSNTLPFSLLFSSDKIDDFFISLQQNPEAEQTLRAVFRKSMSTISYLQNRKRNLECSLIEEQLKKEDPDFQNLSDKKKLKKIEKKRGDKERYDKYIYGEMKNFSAMGIEKAMDYLRKRELLTGELDQVTQEAVNRSEKKRKDILNLSDDNDTSNIEDLKKELVNGRLSPKAKEKLQNICSDFAEEMMTIGKNSRMSKYMPLLMLAFPQEKDIEAKIAGSGGYEHIVEMYINKINEILKKSDEDNLSEADLDSLEYTINDYFKFQKSLAVQTVNVSEMVDENGDLVVKIVNTAYQAWENIVTWISLIRNWNWIAWGGMIAGGAFTLYCFRHPIRMWRLGLRAGVKTTGFALKHGGKALAFTAGKGMTQIWRGASNFIPPYVWKLVHDEHSLKMAIFRGDLSFAKATKIMEAKKIRVVGTNSNSRPISQVEDVLEHFLIGKNTNERKEIVRLLDRYGDNPEIYKQIFESDYHAKRRIKPKDRFKSDYKKWTFSLNEKNLLRLKDINKRIDGFPVWSVERETLSSMMKSVKNLEYAEDFSIMTIGDDMVKFLKTGEVLSPKQYGNYLAKYAGKMDANDLRALEKFIIDAKASGKIGGNSKLFIRNAMKNFKQIQANHFQLDAIEKIWLNTGKWEKLAQKTKASTAQAVEKLNTNLKNPKLGPFHKGMQKQLKVFKEFWESITPEGIKSLSKMQGMNAIGKFSELAPAWSLQLQKLSAILANKEEGKALLKLLTKSKDIKETRSILSNAGINSAAIPDDRLQKMAQAKGGKKIKDIAEYGAGVGTVSKFKSLLQNPAVRTVGRAIGKWLVVADGVFVALDVYSWFKEADEIRKTNQERAERRKQQTYFDGVTWTVSACAGAAYFIPSLMVIPWAGWAAAGVAVGALGIKAVGDKYYEDIDKFKQNQQDFLNKGIAISKQELFSIDGWQQGLDRTWIDKMANIPGYAKYNPCALGLPALASYFWTKSTNQKEALAPKTKKEALAALVTMEELQNYPYAGKDLNDDEIRNNPAYVEAINKEKDLLNEAVDRRLKYFEKYYFQENKPLVTKDTYKEAKGIKKIEEVLISSAQYAVLLNDKEYAGEETIERYKEDLKKNLMLGNEKTFEKYEQLFTEDREGFLRMYTALGEYDSCALQHGLEGYDSPDNIRKRDYFKKYVEYKMLGLPKNMYPESVDPDYRELHNLLEHTALVPIVFETKESVMTKEFLTDSQFCREYDCSPNLWENIIYQRAKRLNYAGENDIDKGDQSRLLYFFSEANKKNYGIYHSWGKWYINENNAKDDFFARTWELNDMKKIEDMRRYIHANTNGSWIHGNMFTESGVINKELGNDFLAIADHHIKMKKGKDALLANIKNYVKQHTTSWNYIKIPIHLIEKGIKSWISWLASSVFRYHNGKIESYSSLVGINSPF